MRIREIGASYDGLGMAREKAVKEIRRQERRMRENTHAGDHTLVPLSPKLEHIFGEIGNQLGFRAEDEVERIFKEKIELMITPPWLKSFTRSERNSLMDRRGVDFIFETDVGPLEVNIKSSLKRAQEFEQHKKSRNIRAIAVDFRKSDGQIYLHVLNILTDMRLRTIRGLPMIDKKQ
jgi:hypothetical protein